MLWTDKRQQPAGEGVVPDLLWQALRDRLNTGELAAFEKDREAAKAHLASRLDRLDAMPMGTDAERASKWEARWVVENWCQQQEVGHFLRWASRTKFNWRGWQSKRAAFVRGEGTAP